MRTLKEWALTLFALVSLFWPWVTVKPFVEVDYERELKVNTQLSARPKSVIDQHKADYQPEIKKRLRIFRRGVWGSFFFLLSAIIAAILIVRFYCQVSPNTKVLLGGGSIFIFAWATLARLGKSATSMGGDTILERVDIRVMWILYWFGTLLGTLAIM